MQRSTTKLLVFLGLSAAVVGASIGCGSSSSTASVAASATSVYPTAYQGAKWASNTTVNFSGTDSCSLTFTTTGVPATHNPYYLGPSTGGAKIVATTPISHLQLALLPYSGITLKGASATINVCPTAAASTTPTTGGVIGFLISGVALFNAYEATGTPALADNVSYSFTDGNGVSQTASFLDSCAAHAAPGMNGGASTWHYHGVPDCVTALVDTAAGPSHLIGFALDGFPIYGGRDMAGNVISLGQLDACNGITSATPEFPAGAYHYVLPIGVTGAQASLGCYKGTVNAKVAAAASKLACRMAGMAAGI